MVLEIEKLETEERYILLGVVVEGAEEMNRADHCDLENNLQVMADTEEGLGKELGMHELCDDLTMRVSSFVRHSLTVLWVPPTFVDSLVAVKDLNDTGCSLSASRESPRVILQSLAAWTVQVTTLLILWRYWPQLLQDLETQRAHKLGTAYEKFCSFAARVW